MNSNHITEPVLTSLLKKFDDSLAKRSKRDQMDFLHSLDQLEQKILQSKRRINQFSR